MNLAQAERFGCAGQGKGHHQYKRGFRVRHLLLQDMESMQVESIRQIYENGRYPRVPEISTQIQPFLIVQTAILLGKRRNWALRTLTAPTRNVPSQGTSILDWSRAITKIAQQRTGAALGLCTGVKRVESTAPRDGAYASA